MRSKGNGSFGHALLRPDRPLGVGCVFRYLLPDCRELFQGDDCRGMIASLDLILVGALEGGTDNDDPAWAQHLQLYVGVVVDGHELA